MCLADGFLIWARREAKGLAVLQIHMRGMTENIKLLGSLFERGKLVEELIFSELCAGKLPLFLSCVSIKYFMLMTPLSMTCN